MFLHSILVYGIWSWTHGYTVWCLIIHVAFILFSTFNPNMSTCTICSHVLFFFTFTLHAYIFISFYYLSDIWIFVFVLYQPIWLTDSPKFPSRQFFAGKYSSRI